jgi:hypothetical protein
MTTLGQNHQAFSQQQSHLSFRNTIFIDWFALFQNFAHVDKLQNSELMKNLTIHLKWRQGLPCRQGRLELALQFLPSPGKSQRRQSILNQMKHIKEKNRYASYEAISILAIGREN